MAKLYITVGDDDNKEFRKDIELEIDGTTALLIRDRGQTADYDDYSRAWDKMCDEISYQHPELPRNWYIYHIDR